MPVGAVGQEPSLPMQETKEMLVQSLSQRDPLEEEMTTHSCSCLGNPIDRETWQVKVHGVEKNWT